MPDQERALIERFKKGDETAFDEIFRRYADRIHGFASRMCRNAEDAQDVLQDTFLAALKNLRGFKGDARLTTYLYKIASSACIKKRRKGKYEPKRELSLEELMPMTEEGDGRRQIPDWSSSPIADLENKRLREALDDAVEALPKEYRLVLILRDMEGLTAEETGRALGITPAAVKSRLHRARLSVRERLSDLYEKKG
jgi:RNA polymerase sigma-70 factor (ECF subfamily)